ncbi:MAG: T9SS type A sorting domain-containing protein [Saprospiraceae bacterium]
MIKHLTTLMLLSMLATAAFAQTPFWAVNFSTGLPAGWTSVDASNQGITWEYCTGPADNCSPVFTGQVPFASSTAANGFMVVNSDASGALLPNNHVSELTTSAINCSAQNQVYAIFQSQIGVFQNTAEANAVLRVSTDKVNWTTFVCFPGLTEFDFFSENPYFSTVNISSVAANQPVVYLQWQWTANWEYLWTLDDVRLFNTNPNPSFDLTLIDFFYPVSSIGTPASQLATDTFGFGVDVFNKGLAASTNVKAVAYVEETTLGDILFTDTVTVPVLAPNDTAFIVFNKLYAPELPVGNYRVRYAVSADEMDERPADNGREAPFFATSFLFSKENGIETATRPANPLPDRWTWGNIYTMASGVNEKYAAREAIFSYACNPAPDPQANDISATIGLYRVNDDILRDYSNFNATMFPPESGMTFIGFALFDAPDTTVNFDVHRLPLTDFSTGDTSVKLDAGAQYYLTVTYEKPFNTAFQSIANDVVHPGVSQLLFITGYSGGFVGNPDPFLRLSIGLVSSVDNTPLPDNTLRIMPNPVNDVLNLVVDFAEPTSTTITLADLTGRVITIDDRPALTNDQIRYNVSSLAPGTYIARIATPNGTLTKKFIVAR